ncbi:hypothetical protein [Sediminivirga luteola]|nr:hypothetical protein [Sediminivirga luteola]
MSGHADGMMSGRGEPPWPDAPSPGVHRLSLGAYIRAVRRCGAALPPGFDLDADAAQRFGRADPPGDQGAGPEALAILAAIAAAPAALRLHCAAGLSGLEPLIAAATGPVRRRSHGSPSYAEGAEAFPPAHAPAGDRRHMLVHLAVAGAVAAMLIRGWSEARPGGSVLVSALPLTAAAGQLSRLIDAFAEEAVVIGMTRYGAGARAPATHRTRIWCHHNRAGEPPGPVQRAIAAELALIIRAGAQP